MHTTLQLIDLAKQRLALKHNLPLPMTDYRLAKILEIKQATVSAWRTRSRRIGTEFVRKFSEACELSEAYVYACIEHERASPDTKGVLERIAAAFTNKAAAAILSAGLLWLSSSFNLENKAIAHESASAVVRVVCILSKVIRRWLHTLLKRVCKIMTPFPSPVVGNGLIFAR